MPHILRFLQWRPPDEEDVDTAEWETTEDNILSIEVADDCLGKGEQDKGDAKVEVHSQDCAHKVYNKGCPVFQVMEHAKSITWRADSTAIIATLSFEPLEASRYWFLTHPEIVSPEEEVENEKNSTDNGVNEVESNKTVVSKSLEEANFIFIIINIIWRSRSFTSHDGV